MSEKILNGRKPVRKKALIISSISDGPWVPIRNVREIHVRDATKKDRIRIHWRNHGFHAGRDPIDIKGSRVYRTHMPQGEVKVERLKGNNPITVMVHSY